jgi:hypothetical protein
MEHWHHSPKRLFRQVSDKLLKPGGRFVLAVPNCVNLRKRLSVPLGVGAAGGTLCEGRSARSNRSTGAMGDVSRRHRGCGADTGGDEEE